MESTKVIGRSSRAAQFKAAVESPEGIAEFCRKNNLKAGSVYSWKREQKRSKRKSSISTFLPIVVKDLDEPNSRCRPVRLPESKWVAEVMLHLIRGLS